MDTREDAKVKPVAAAPAPEEEDELQLEEELEEAEREKLQRKKEAERARARDRAGMNKDIESKIDEDKVRGRRPGRAGIFPPPFSNASYFPRG